MQVLNFTLALCGGSSLDEPLYTCASMLGKCFIAGGFDVGDLAL